MATPAPAAAAPAATTEIKSDWTPKREEKLNKAFNEIIADGKLTVPEVQKVLGKLKYELNDADADKFIKSVDKNGDHQVQWPEFLAGVKELVKTHPKTKKADKDKKDKKDKGEKDKKDKGEKGDKDKKDKEHKDDKDKKDKK
eukprot:TRINITY_DN6442_c0_g1_i4.p1 TRINITY_DN6442_c0_g1~~TRINITY_DN6442_c0_g1_i4.p1  ORF type:complete len:142 (+),score=74.34 TRINITY_DN6442_c0_g1_i4:90-515(+)